MSFPCSLRQKGGQAACLRDALVFLFSMALFWPSRAVFGQVLMLFGEQALLIGDVHGSSRSLISIVAVIACATLMVWADSQGTLTHRRMCGLVGAVAARSSGDHRPTGLQGRRFASGGGCRPCGNGLFVCAAVLRMGAGGRGV